MTTPKGCRVPSVGVCRAQKYKAPPARLPGWERQHLGRYQMGSGAPGLSPGSSTAPFASRRRTGLQTEPRKPSAPPQALHMPRLVLGSFGSLWHPPSSRQECCPGTGQGMLLRTRPSGWRCLEAMKERAQGRTKRAPHLGHIGEPEAFSSRDSLEVTTAPIHLHPAPAPSSTPFGISPVPFDFLEKGKICPGVTAGFGTETLPWQQLSKDGLGVQGGSLQGKQRPGRIPGVPGWRELLESHRRVTSQTQF